MNLKVKIPKIVRADLLIAESKNLYIFTTSKEISCFLILISHRCLKKFHSFAVLRASQIQQKKVNSFTIVFDLKNPLSNSTQVIAKKVYNCSNIN